MAFYKRTLKIFNKEIFSFADKTFLLLFIPVTISLIIISIYSLSWKMIHDLPVMMYISFLIDEFGMIPYKYIFDNNMPGSYFFYILIGKIFTYSDLGLRIADLTILIIISVCVFYFLKEFGFKTASFSAALFSLFYLRNNPFGILERE